MKYSYVPLFCAAALAMGAFAQETAAVGILKVDADTTMKKIPVGVTFTEGGGNATSISVASLVKTANLAAGDKLYVYNTATDNFNVYILNNSGVWVGGTTYKVGEGSSSVQDAPDPATTYLNKGVGAFIERQSTSTPVYILGAVSTDASITLAPGANLMVVPKATAYSLNDASITWTGVNASTFLTSGDNVMLRASGKRDYIKVAKSDDGQFDIYYYKDGSGWGKVVNNRFVEAPAIPAGVAFWYNNVGQSNVTVAY